MVSGGGQHVKRVLRHSHQMRIGEGMVLLVSFTVVHPSSVVVHPFLFADAAAKVHVSLENEELEG